MLKTRIHNYLDARMNRLSNSVIDQYKTISALQTQLDNSIYTNEIEGTRHKIKQTKELIKSMEWDYDLLHELRERLIKNNWSDKFEDRIKN